jgi:hypothetical protein
MAQIIRKAALSLPPPSGRSRRLIGDRRLPGQNRKLAFRIRSPETGRSALEHQGRAGTPLGQGRQLS